MSKQVINDFSITIATINGSGSQTANVTLLRALFKMGIPVSGKNLFPSNIQGLPTWYTIRINSDGFTSRQREQEVVVTLNPASFAQDLKAVQPGGAFYYADDIKLPIDRNDISIYAMPIKELSAKTNISPSLRDYIANMLYVGILVQMLGIDMEKIKQALNFHFKGKNPAIESNQSAIEVGFQWAKQNLSKSDPFIVREMDKTNNLIMSDGNTAAALGAIYGGIQFAAWYPITPASTLAESLNVYLPQLRKTEDGKKTYAVLQAEDELAAIGMAIGAGWGGLRSMTSTSGPGVSLMSEYAGLAYYAEVPVVVWDVQRIGPSTGLPTRTAQGDLTQVYYLSHGDKEHVVLLPGSVNECFEFGWKAFDIAEQLQTPVFVLSDLDLGMNQWMAEPFKYPEAPLERGKILWETDLDKLSGSWKRYQDIDGDGISYRTLPGNQHPGAAWFGRGTGHDESARYSEDAVTWENNLARLKKKYITAKKLVPKPVVINKRNSYAGLIAYGSTELAVVEAITLLENEKQLSLSSLRLRALPPTKELEDFIANYKKIFIVEANRDGQLCQILSSLYPLEASKFVSVCHSDGLPMTARWIVDALVKLEGNS